jgi:type II secretory pathway pseudopilin PulG
VSCSPRQSHTKLPLRRCARGFTYAVMLAMVLILAITAGVAEEMVSRQRHAEREVELLFRGNAYVRAIKSYHEANGQYPRQLQDLVKDPRAAHRRHIRALYHDPMAKGEAKQWQLIQSPDGGIAGVVSTSSDEPLKKANFPSELKQFEQAKSYKEWLFEYVPRLRGSITQPQGIPPR